MISSVVHIRSFDFTSRYYTERGYATLCHLSVRPSVCAFVRLSVRFRYRDHIGWNTSKIILRFHVPAHFGYYRRSSPTATPQN